MLAAVWAVWEVHFLWALRWAHYRRPSEGNDGRTEQIKKKDGKASDRNRRS